MIRTLPEGAVPHCQDVDVLDKPPYDGGQAYVWHYGDPRNGYRYFDATTSEGHNLICDGYCEAHKWEDARPYLEALIAVRTGCWPERGQS